MLWRPSSHKIIVQIVDFISVIFGFVSSYLVWNKIIVPYYYPNYTSIIVNENHFLILFILSYLFILVLNEKGAYSYQRFTSIFIEVAIILKSSFYVAIIAVFLSYMFGEKSIPRTFFALSFSFILIIFLIEKIILFHLAKLIRKNGKNRKRIIIIGTGTRARKFIETVLINKSWGLDIIGLLTGDKEIIGTDIKGFCIIDHYENIENIIKKYNPEEIIITISTKRFDRLREVLELCEKVGIQVRLNSDFFGHLTKKVRIDKVYDLNIISFNFTSQSEIQLILKRLFDIFTSLVLIIILSPILILISIIIIIQDGRPVLYQWKIMGYNRKPLTSWKFRTMVRNADEIKKELMKNNEMRGPVFKLTNDPRILPIGRVLRKYSLDELPQLFSVLKGDLSLVGPRPPLQYEFNEFDLWHRRKLSVKPGLTCLWQVSGRSEITNFDDWARLDLEYIDNWSLLLDFKILLKTIPVVLFGKGAK